MTSRPKTILIADDDPEILKVLTIRCQSMGFYVESTRDGLRALLLARKLSPDLLILDLSMPEVDGMRVCETLADPKYPRIPVLFLTGAASEANVAAFAELGASYCKKGHGAWDTLMPMISSILGVDAPAAEGNGTSSMGSLPVGHCKRKILIVDDDRDFITGIESRMRKYGFDTVSARNGMDAFDIALRERPDVIVTDYVMPGGSGDWLLARLSNSAFLKATPVIVVSGNSGNDQYLHHHVMDVRGAASYLQKPFDSERLLQEIDRVTAV